MYCVFTSQETPLSVGLSFFLMPSFFAGVTTPSSRNNSSSSGARGGLTDGGLNRQKLSDLEKENAKVGHGKVLSVGLVLVYTKIKQIKWYSKIWLNIKLRLPHLLKRCDGILGKSAKHIRKLVKVEHQLTS